MPILTELVVSIVGGVATALILGALVGGGSASRDTQARHGGTLFADLVHLLLAVAGGIAAMFFLGRMLIQAGILPKSLASRLGVLVAGTALSWLILLPLRRR